MHAEQQQLRHLDVSGARVHTVSVRTTTLRTLAARACPRLEAVRLAAAPQHCDLHNCRQLRLLDIDAAPDHAALAVSEVELGGCDSMHSGARASVRAWATRVRATD
eukprot:jgi/Ulvmu1/11599/UM079_0044.1